MLTSPLFVILFNTTLMKEALSTRKLIAISMGIVGGIMLINPQSLGADFWANNGVSRFLTGAALTTLASVCLALSVLATKKASKDLDAYSLTFWSMMIGLLILLPFALTEHQSLLPTENPAYAFFALAYLGLFCSVLAFLLWNQAIVWASPQHIASTMHIKTPVAVLLGVLIASEPITPTLLIGTVLISIAVWFSQTSSISKKG